MEVCDQPDAPPALPLGKKPCRGQLKCDGTYAETSIRLSAKRTSPFKSAGASVQSTTGSRGVRISGSNAGYTMFRGSVKGTGYSLHSPVSPSFPLPASPCAITFQLESTSRVGGWVGSIPTLWRRNKSLASPRIRNPSRPDRSLCHVTLSVTGYRKLANKTYFRIL